MVNLHFKPMIAVDELDGTDTFGIFELVFLLPMASLDGSDGNPTREPHNERESRVRRFGRRAWVRMSRRGTPAVRGLGLASAHGSGLHRRFGRI